MKRNLPCRRGRELGDQVARLTPEVAEMCHDCAFKRGTIANGCAQTMVDAVSCVISGTPFHCHIRKDEDGQESLCAGFMSALNAAHADILLEAANKPR